MVPSNRALSKKEEEEKNKKSKRYNSLQEKIGGQASGAVHGFKPSGRPFPAASRCRRRGSPLPGSAPACWDRLCRRTGFFSCSTPGERGEVVGAVTCLPTPARDKWAYQNAAASRCRFRCLPDFAVGHPRRRSSGAAATPAGRARLWCWSGPVVVQLWLLIAACGVLQSLQGRPTALRRACVSGQENFLKERLRHCLHEDTLSNPESTPKYAYRLVASLAQELLHVLPPSMLRTRLSLTVQEKKRASTILWYC
ncbi:hypothetical protein HPB51_021745 [Rhipicephalus microplus]|uniref:Uncharacterized protein n=1 Tax=Rhipicephalus microplus TaxID=6941 RepID=A0A9J6DPY7_RHIMP|nr:hypothetical protein HPB51_021745 [Rhipicephalus microplus]